MAWSRVAFGDPFREPAAVLPDSYRLGDQLVPVVRIGADDPAVAHHESDPCRMKVVFRELQGPPQVALPAVRISGEQEVERPCLGPGMVAHMHHSGAAGMQHHRGIVSGPAE